MNLQESGEMYLETILILSKEKPSLRSIDIVEHLGYSKPSVSRAVNLLKNGGFILIDENSFISLTETGREIAQKIYNRHTVITAFLEKLGIEHATADFDACKIEHVISDESFDAIKKFCEGL